MGKIKEHIMAFVGTGEMKALIDELSEYTDNIYAVVSEEYGNVDYPGGNITVISKHLDEDGIRRWISGSDIKLVIDGTAAYAAKESELIKKVVEDMGVDHIRTVGRIEINQHIHISRNVEDILRRIEYSHGNVLVKGDKKLLHELTAWVKYSEKICPLVMPDDVMIRELIEAGYSRENIICHGRDLSADFLVAIIDEYDITQFIIMGYERVGMAERIQAAERSRSDVIICGEIDHGEGMLIEEVWNILEKRYGL